MKKYIPNNNGLFKTHKSHSIDEVLAAGGPTEFGLKMLKNGKSLIKALKSAPKIEPFTDGEWDDLMKQLKNDK